VHFYSQPYVLFTLSLPLHFIYLLHLLSTNHKCTQPYYFPLLLRRRRWTGILQRGVLGYMLPQLPFLWCYGVFRCSVLLRVILVFKDIIYVIIILYIHDIWLSVSSFGHMGGTTDPRSCIRWVLGFGIKLTMTPQECTWHEEAVFKGDWPVGPSDGRPTKLPGRSAPLHSLSQVAFIGTLSRRW
jgi:hypothetical protein